MKDADAESNSANVPTCTAHVTLTHRGIETSKIRRVSAACTCTRHEADGCQRGGAGRVANIKRTTLAMSAILRPYLAHVAPRLLLCCYCAAVARACREGCCCEFGVCCHSETTSTGAGTGLAVMLSCTPTTINNNNTQPRQPSTVPTFVSTTLRFYDFRHRRALAALGPAPIDSACPKTPNQSWFYGGPVECVIFFL